MSWRKYVIVLCGLLGIMAAGFLARNLLVQNYAQAYLDDLNAQIEARQDGSSLIYNALDANANHATLARIIYQDGSTGARIALFDLEADYTREDLKHLRAGRVELINAKGNLLTLNDLSIDDMRPNPKANHEWNSYLFERLQARDITLSGLASNAHSVDVQIEQVALEAFDETRLEDFWLRNVDIRYNPEISAHLDDIRAKSLEYAKINEMIEKFDEGYIPIKLFSEIAGTDMSLDGLSLDIDDKTIIGQGNGILNDKKLLQLFLDYAPEELTDLIGTRDADELQSLLETLDAQNPEDIARRALEFMLEMLNN